MSKVPSPPTGHEISLLEERTALEGALFLCRGWSQFSIMYFIKNNKKRKLSLPIPGRWDGLASEVNVVPLDHA